MRDTYTWNRGPHTVDVVAGNKKLKIRLPEAVEKAVDAQRIAHAILFKAYYPQYELPDYAAPYSANLQAVQQVPKAQFDKAMREYRVSALASSEAKIAEFSQSDEMADDEKAYLIYKIKKRVEVLRTKQFKWPSYDQFRFEMSGRADSKAKRDNDAVYRFEKICRMFHLDATFEFDRTYSPGSLQLSCTVDMHKRGKTRKDEPTFLFRLAHQRDVQRPNFTQKLADLQAGRTDSGFTIDDGSKFMETNYSLKLEAAELLINQLVNEGIIEDENHGERLCEEKDAKREQRRQERDARIARGEPKPERKERRSRGGRGRKRGNDFTGKPSRPVQYLNSQPPLQNPSYAATGGQWSAGPPAQPPATQWAPPAASGQPAWKKRAPNNMGQQQQQSSWAPQQPAVAPMNAVQLAKQQMMAFQAKQLEEMKAMHASQLASMGGY